MDKPTKTLTKHEQAAQFLASGIAVIPLRHRGKEPESGMMGGTWEKYRQELPTEYDVTRWLYSGWQNYGVVAGWRNLAVIDFDDADAYEIWRGWFDLLNKHVEVYPVPYIVKTSRGAHVYVSMPGAGDMANEKRRGVDLKFHGYVVGPGSIHPTGAEYRAITEFRLVEVYSLDTILPPELFPKIDCGPSCGHLGPLQGQLSPQIDGLKPVSDYDPFQMAMFAGDMDLIGTVKARVRIETMFGEIHQTSRDGRWYATLCPFHDDHNPSAWIDTRRQLFGCNSCGFKPMDVINLYARQHNMPESEAVTAMAKEIGVWG